MKKKSFFTCIFLFLLIILIFCNCQTKKEGIVFSFDDCYIDEWYAHRALFNKYDVRATFFITRPHLLDSNQIFKLKILESDGHEIACHGYGHKNATDYQVPEDYINQQIKPALQNLQEIGFNVTSFAYPFGASTTNLDSLLLIYFRTIRKATYNIQNTTIDQYSEIYANNNSFRIVNSMGIDNNYAITPENFKTGILRARKNNEMLILHAHRIDTSYSEYTVNSEYLEELFLICKKYRIISVTMDGMYNYFQKNSKIHN
jgi:peptidoglycan/xylan/chitin deacetylase (PgdA/CDA1 family)